MQPLSINPAQAEQIAAFERKLIDSYELLERNGQPVYFAGSLQDSIGSEQAAAFLAEQLTMSFNQKVAVSYNSQADCTTVHFTNKNLGLESSVDSVTSKTMELGTSSSLLAVHGRKNPPRPMNCWMMFRDAKHRELKLKDKDLSVQDISKISSDYWKHKMPPAEKEFWRKQAADAKTEHRRAYPDYKYAPRKPGQKKKRQSRKAAQAAAADAAATAARSAMASPPTVDFNSYLDSTPIISTTDLPSTAAADAIATNISSAFPYDVASFPEAVIGLGLDMQQSASDYIQDPEYGRHHLLLNQFNGDFSFELFDDDESFAFRDDADMNVTMPSLYTDTY